MDWIDTKDRIPNHENKVLCKVITTGGDKEQVGYFCHDKENIDAYGWNFELTKDVVLQIIAWKEI